MTMKSYERLLGWSGGLVFFGLAAWSANYADLFRVWGDFGSMVGLISVTGAMVGVALGFVYGGEDTALFSDLRDIPRV